MSHATWDSERRAQALIERRSALLDRLPGEIRAARDLPLDIRELILDESITFAAVEHDRPVSSREELERTFWAACAFRVRRAHQGRYDTVRAGWGRAEPAAVDEVAAAASPEDQVVARDERHAVMEFAATLSPLEREVLACKYRGANRQPLGYKQISRHLRLRRGDVLKAERGIDHKLERFATIVSAGRLCGFRAPAVASLAAGEATSEQAMAARVHLQHCPACATAYKRHLHYVQGATFQRSVAGLLPLPPMVAAGGSPGWRDAVAEWVSRPFAQQGTQAATDLATSGVGRGAGTVVAVKLASLCIGGAGAVSACVAAGVVPEPFIDRPPVKRSSHVRELKKPERERAAARRAARAAATPTPALAAPTATPMATLTPTPTPFTRRRRPRTQGGTGPRDHERAPAPAQPVRPRASVAGVGGAPRPPARRKPAPAPATGASEFF